MIRELLWLDGIILEIRYAVRRLRNSPSFTLVSIAILALSIGINAAVFKVTNAVLFEGFPLVQRNNRILYISSQLQCCASYPDFEDWRAQAQSFAGMGAVADLRITLSDKSGLPESYIATRVTANTFRLVGQRPVLGRDFAPSDETPGAAAVAILSYGFWERRYGKDTGIIGRTLRIDSTPTTVIGVMPQGFSFPQNQDLWVPLVPTPNLQKRETRGLFFAFGRLAEGVTIENARVEMQSIGRRLANTYPLTNQGFSPVVQRFQDFFIGPDATMIYGSMLGAVGFVLLIACANLANLTLARAIRRSHEISVRVALGAERWRIIRQLLMESLILSVAGGFFGWWVAKWSVRVYELTATPPAWFDHVLDYQMDYHVVAYLTAISMGTGLLFGLVPAIWLSKVDVNAVLKDGGRGASGGGTGKRLSAFLVIGEIALAVVLLAGAGVLIRSFLNIYFADLGVKTANVLTALIALPKTKYPEPAAQITFYDRLKAGLETIPGLQSVAFADVFPTYGARRLPYEIAGAEPTDEQRRPTLSVLIISPSYFRTLGAPVLSGREFNDTDGVSGIPVAIVNKRLVDKFWPGENPVGRRIRLFNEKTPGAWLIVVGVVSNIIQNDATRQGFDPLIYLPYVEEPSGAMWVFMRTAVPPGSLESAFRRKVREMDSELPIWLGPYTLVQRLEEGYRNNRSLGVLFLIFAVMALLLASIGLYAVVADTVEQLTIEIGIRIAIGATPNDVRKFVIIRGAYVFGIGLAVGLAGTFAVTPLLKSALVKVMPVDPLTLTIALAVLILAAILGCLIPARRAMGVDPVVALRHD